MDLQISGKKAIMAGGSAGMGRATAERLAEGGVELFITARREERLVWFVHFHHELPQGPQPRTYRHLPQTKLSQTKSSCRRMSAIRRRALANEGPPCG